MRYILIILTVCFSLNLYYSTSYSLDEDKIRERRLSDQELQKLQQASRERPILPPVVPASTSMISPTPSPQIAAPQIPRQVISQPPQVQQNVPVAPVMQNIPSAPAYVAYPNVPMPVDIPKISVIGNTIGKVVKTGSDKDGGLFIEVDDELFGEITRVSIKDLERTPVVRQASIYDFNNIKPGDTVNVMFHTEEDENVANFISVLTEEEIEMRKEMPGPAKPESESVTNNSQSQKQ
jgi:hypothetical protein